MIKAMCSDISSWQSVEVAYFSTAKYVTTYKEIRISKVRLEKFGDLTLHPTYLQTGSNT